jgi:phosphoglycolate phosphatase-like HAD superfamily hydrolase
LLKSAVRQVEASASVDIDTDGVIADLDEVLVESGYAGTYAFNAYTDILDRDPTTEELEMAVQMIGVIDKPAETLSELPNVQKLIEQLILSEEFLAQYAEGPLPFVELLYEELLGVVTPDPAHVQYFVDLLDAGLTPEDVAWLFLNSDVQDQVYETAEGSVEIVGAIPDPSI